MYAQYCRAARLHGSFSPLSQLGSTGRASAVGSAGEQAEVFAARPPAPTIPETVLVKLRPGQAIEIEMHAVKGLGRDHAKFSPVGTCSSPSPLTSLLKNSVWCSDSELPTVTAHHLGQSKSCTTTSCDTLPGLLLTRGHQRRPPAPKMSLSTSAVYEAR
jgi:hypothetical protein